jgi:hypothetical protein
MILIFSPLQATDTVGTLYTHTEVRNLEIDLAYYKQVFVLVRAELGKPLVITTVKKACILLLICLTSSNVLYSAT